MESSTAQKRSRRGCERCRSKRQKCDEKRPSCGQCIPFGVPCCYRPLNIRWGGRSFAQSRFGNCEVRKIENESGNFVYSVKEASRSPASSTQDRGPAAADGAGENYPPLPYSATTLSPHSSPIGSERQFLIEYFIHSGSAAISPHQRLQKATCRVLVPLALQATPVLHAISAFSAAQWASYTTDQYAREDLLRKEAQSRAICIRAIQEEIGSSTESVRPTVVMASSLLLCLSALYYQNDDYNSWRVYFKGVQASYPLSCPPQWRNMHNQTLEGFLHVRYRILQTVAMFSASVDRIVDDADHLIPDNTPQRPYLGVPDHLLQGGNNLFQLLRAISIVAQEKRQHETSYPNGSVGSDLDFNIKADKLESLALRMIEQGRNVPPPAFLLSHKENLDAEQVAEFTICHRIYEYMGLLHIRTKIRNQRPEAPSVQEVVKNIIELAKKVNVRPGLSPSLCLNVALFPAGQNALAQDRPVIRRLLVDIYNATHNRNFMVALDNLEKHWQADQKQDENTEGLDFISF